MRLVSTHSLVTTAALALAMIATAPAASADDDDAPASATPSTGPGTKIGVGVRLRNVRIPQGLIEAFVDSAPGGSSNVGFGLEVSRRRGQFEVQLGLEYDSISIKDGLWIEKDKPIPANEPDYVEFEGFGWFTAELSFMYHTPIIDQLSVRYGGGAGIAVFTGDVIRTDYRCTSTAPDSCMEYSGAENVKNPYDLPPVFFVVNAIVGLQIKPTEEIFINVEGGIRTLPFFGMTAGYYF